MKAKKSPKDKFEPLSDSERFEDGKRVTEAKILKRKTSQREEVGISIRMGKKVSYLDRPLFGKGLWITRELDIKRWLKWLTNVIKKLYSKAFNKEVELEDIEFWKAKVSELTAELTRASKRLEELQQKQEETKKLLELAQKVRDKFHEYAKKFEEFRTLVEKSYYQDVRLEETIKRFLKENRWLLGLECQIEATNKKIDSKSQIDLHVVTKYNQHRIFELKSPNLKPFVSKSGRMMFSRELSEGLSELIRYIRDSDLYSRIQSLGTYGILKPTGVIVMGYNLTKEEYHFLKALNFFLYPHIQVVTYNDLIETSQRELSLIENLKPENKHL